MNTLININPTRVKYPKKKIVDSLQISYSVT